jgi:hypothetical protein
MLIVCCGVFKIMLQRLIEGIFVVMTICDEGMMECDII